MVRGSARLGSVSRGHCRLRSPRPNCLHRRVRPVRRSSGRQVGLAVAHLSRAGRRTLPVRGRHERRDVTGRVAARCRSLRRVRDPRTSARCTHRLLPARGRVGVAARAGVHPDAGASGAGGRVVAVSAGDHGHGDGSHPSTVRDSHRRRGRPVFAPPIGADRNHDHRRQPAAAGRLAVVLAQR